MEKITKKQKTILILIFAFRFINSKQIQEFLKHKDHRRINSWLKDLVEKEYVERDFKPVFGTLTKPAVYFLNKLGRDYLRKTYGGRQERYLARLREDKKRSKSFRIRRQIVADFFLIYFSRYVAQYPLIITERLGQGTSPSTEPYRFFTPAFYEELPPLRFLL